MNEPIVYDNLTQHLILFSKHQYGRTDDIVDDLATFMSKWSGVEKSAFTERELMNVMALAFSDCANRYDVHDFIRGIATPSSRYVLQTEPMNLRQMIESMLGILSCIQVREYDKDGKLYDLIKLPEPNPKYFIGDMEVRL